MNNWNHMSEGYEHTSRNQVNIQIKLCVCPNIVSKGTKTWIKRSLRVVTWPGYKRKDICGSIEFKWPSIREHSFYSHSKDKFTWIPLILNNPWCLNMTHLDLDNLFIFSFFLSFSLFLYHVHIFSFLFFFFFYLQHNVVLITK